ncbi:MAG: aminotransferase class V-fold PLP-dependent enzyme [Oscillospiraceae bacterium]|nr:aminotransferase class V-fold PLP-dependent enzyme [Oscillospiraceae bacterium]MCL2279240.1 aminotransferase class V-fold PLP-dependent enzyme [Oscillospiraceae bacterium]
MKKYSFKNDYSEMAHPLILEALASVKTAQFEGYGLCSHCEEAAGLIRKKLGAPDADIHFISGGTLSNLTVISSALRPHEAVISAETGHIFVHETGAIEATGHKVCTRAGYDGKLSASDIKSVIEEHCDEHMVKPRLVYISHSTEGGTVYTKAELTAISEKCKENGLYLYIDGARLGTAMNSSACDLEYRDIAKFADVIFIGGTKLGALFGEAVAIFNDELKQDFRFLMKQRGALLAKSAAMGVQFKTLFADGLYDRLARHSIDMAAYMADGMKALGYDLLFPAQTNFVVPLLPCAVSDKLCELYDFHEWKRLEKDVAVRLVISWATQQKAIDEFLEDLKNLR